MSGDVHLFGKQNVVFGLVAGDDCGVGRTLYQRFTRDSRLLVVIDPENPCEVESVFCQRLQKSCYLFRNGTGLCSL
jgi:hypothetical protein